MAIRIDERFFSDFYMDLSIPERQGWLHFIAFASRSKGTVRKRSLHWLSIELHVEEQALASLIEKALAAAMLKESSEEWYVENWENYKVDRTSGKRQRCFRARLLQRLSQSVPVHETEKEYIIEKEKLLATYAEMSVKWNCLAADFPALIRAPQPTPPRLKQLADRLKDPNFNFDSILLVIRNNECLHRPTSKGWVVSFDWILGGPDHYQHIFNVVKWGGKE